MHVAFVTFTKTISCAITSDFGEDSVIMGLLLVLLAQLLGTGVFMVYIDTMGRRVLLLAGTFCYCNGEPHIISFYLLITLFVFNLFILINFLYSQVVP